jgi:hypothetical protein
MWFNSRQVVTGVLLVSLVVALWLVSLGIIELFPRNLDSATAINCGLYLFSTCAQVLAGVFAIYIGLFFLFAQIAAKPHYSRVVSELYQSGTFLLLPLLYLLTIVFCLVLITHMGVIVRKDSLQVLLDDGLILSVWCLLFLVPSLMTQVENLFPPIIAQKLARRITPVAIRDYGLAHAETDEDGKVTRYYLKRWGQRHHLYDPMGALHELIMQDVREQNRVRMTAVLRAVIQHEAEICGTRLRTHFEETFWDKVQRRIVALRSRTERGRGQNTEQSGSREQVIVVLHVHHYLIRRAHNLKNEWVGSCDSLRQMFNVLLADFIESLILTSGPQIPACLALFTILHINLGFRQFDPRTNTEHLTTLFSVAKRLFEQGHTNNARLTIQILAFLSVHSQFLRRLDVGQYDLPQDLWEVWVEERIQIIQSASYLPWDITSDPWHDLMKQYSCKPSRHAYGQKYVI